ncbi:MAG: hypothetical protein ACPG51_13165, partial [Thiolinea sp.]
DTARFAKRISADECAQYPEAEGKYHYFSVAYPSAINPAVSVAMRELGLIRSSYHADQQAKELA